MVTSWESSPPAMRTLPFLSGVAVAPSRAVCMLPVGTKLSGRDVGLGEGVGVGDGVTVGLAIAEALALGDGVEAGLVGALEQPASPMTAMRLASAKRKPGDFGRGAPVHGGLAAFQEGVALVMVSAPPRPRGGGLSVRH